MIGLIPNFYVAFSAIIHLPSRSQAQASRPQATGIDQCPTPRDIQSTPYTDPDVPAPYGEGYQYTATANGKAWTGQTAATKDDYLAFLGRIVPCKGAHSAIAVARRAGLRLKLAGEVQPVYERYWREQVLPEIDGDQIQYLGEADQALKNELLAGARALLFPIEWDEPFGLVMIEAMACGTPVLAFRGGSVDEVVGDGVSGWLCRDIDDMAARAVEPGIAPESCRAWIARKFSRERMVARYLDVYQRARSRRGQAIDQGAAGSWTT